MNIMESYFYDFIVGMIDAWNSALCDLHTELHGLTDVLNC